MRALLPPRRGFPSFLVTLTHSRTRSRTASKNDRSRFSTANERTNERTNDRRLISKDFRPLRFNLLYPLQDSTRGPKTGVLQPLHGERPPEGGFGHLGGVPRGVRRASKARAKGQGGEGAASSQGTAEAAARISRRREVEDEREAGQEAPPKARPPGHRGEDRGPEQTAYTDDPPDEPPADSNLMILQSSPSWMGPWCEEQGRPDSDVGRREGYIARESAREEGGHIWSGEETGGAKCR
ncbi:hypothetical protein ACJZ2D_000090 [Fusarium nematophilum]